jgi:membrane-associated PAP2 superfamily phosphatase
MHGAWLLLALLALAAWDASGLDMPLAQVFGNAQGFPLRDHPWLAQGLHDGVRQLGWLLLLGLTLAVGWPVGALKALRRGQRAWMVGSVWAALVVVVVLKGLNRTSCPWDLTAFGGTAQHLSHWWWGVADGGPGHCFPGGHASTAFAFLPLAWWLRPVNPVAARRWALAIVLGGLLLGAVQQARGAHFLSHNLWTGWLCWATTWGLHRLSTRTR